MWPLEFDRVAPTKTLLTRAKRESKTGEARHASSAHRASSCPSWDRTRTLLIQSQACCQLHQGAPYPKTIPSARPGERRRTTKCVGSWGSGVVDQHAYDATPAAREPVGP